MGKLKNHKALSGKRDHGQSAKSNATGIKRRQHSQGKQARHNISKKPSLPPTTNSRIQAPFSKHDHVLLVGEGDYSFTLSLVQNHQVEAIVATSYDNDQELKQKYPSIDATLQQIVSATKSKEIRDEVSWDGFSSDEGDDDQAQNDKSPRRTDATTILHGIDATSMSKAHRKALSQHAPFTKIVFNFPHTGGLSTDVNRQVRANQELLVGFFNSAKSLLATRARPAKSTKAGVTSGAYGDDECDEDGMQADNDGRAILSTGRVLVTLFEGEPYTLWNIRDLARHSGLQVIESFKFPWVVYPGYKHARTIGDITKGQDRDDGKRKGAWRGEERDARTYVIALKDEVTGAGAKKRKRGDESDGSD